jgi:glycosyltransferase involved in cell wall biosynthesis
VVNRYTTDLMPVKLKEYLAAGIPIVSTSLPEVRRFTSDHGPVVSFADGADAFVAALRRAIEIDGPALVARRRDIARRYDWSVQMATMSAAIESVLAGPIAAVSAAG